MATSTPPAVNIADWATRPLSDILYACRDLLEDMTFPTVQAWKAKGGKVVGHFQVYFPEEIVHAAGMLPVKVRGGPVEMRLADSHFGSYLCSILRSSLELALNDTLALDMFVTHPICDAARNLCGVWARNFPYPARILYLPQNPNSKYSGTYLREEYAQLLREIEDVAGRKVSEGELRHSISVFNKNRRLLRELYAIKRETPWLVSVDEAYVLMAVGSIVPREEHNTLLAAVLPMLRTRQARRLDKVRVVFEGGFCEQPPLDLLGVIAQSCYVVDDDLLIGLRFIESEVASQGDSLHNLAMAYLDGSGYSAVQHDLRKPKEEMLLKRVRESHADAVILAAAKMCEPGLDEQVTYSKTLEEAGVPHFVTEFEEKMSGFDQMQMQLETFVESILFD